MSITDDENEQIESEGGLCIYSTKNTTIDSCYFFAIYSLRSGSAIFFEEKDNHINATVVNCMFKSISQAIYLHDNNYFSGGAISYGYFRINNDYDNTMPQYISSSKTNNCYFDNVRLIGYIYAAAQFGIVSYFSHYIESKNLNFSACGMIGYSQQMGFLCFFWADYSINSFSFINFFDCSCKEYGSFSVDIENDINNQVFSLSFANFINNSNQNDEYQSQFMVFEYISVRTYLKLSNIQCNSKETFIIYGYSLYEENHSTIDIIVSDSLFGCSADSFIFYTDESATFNEFLENNVFDYTDFDVDITNDVISIFGYIQTSIFSPSNMFSNVQTSATYFDLYKDNSFRVIIISIVIGVISIIILIIILCYRRKIINIDIEQFTQLDFGIENNCIDDENKSI